MILVIANYSSEIMAVKEVAQQPSANPEFCIQFKIKKKTGVATLISYKVNFRAKKVIRDEDIIT